MDLTFGDEVLEHRCTCEEASVIAWGDEHARVIRRRMVQLAAAESLATVRSFPFCTLTHAENGRYVLQSHDRLRIVLAVHLDESGPLDEGAACIRELCILAVEVPDDD